MKSNYKIFTAVFLSAIMTAAAPLTVCGAEVFSAGESFSDGTGSIPAILTDMVLPGGEIGAEYQVQLEACLLYTSPSPRDVLRSRMPSSA